MAGGRRARSRCSIETSGSTGRPKGVVLPRRAVLASVEASARRLGGTGRWLLALPSSYVAGVQVIVRSLVAGHEPVVVEGLDIGGAVAADGRDPDVRLARADPAAPASSATPSRSRPCARCHAVLLGGGAVDPALRGAGRGAGRPGGRHVRLVARPPAAASTTACRSTGSAWRSAPTGRVRIAGPTLFERLRRRPRADRRVRSSTAGSSPPTPAASTRTAACRSRPRRRRGRQRRREGPGHRRRRGGCASTPRRPTPRSSASPTPSGASGSSPSSSATSARPSCATGSATSTPGRGRRASSGRVESLPLLPNGKVDRQAIRAAL